MGGQTKDAKRGWGERRREKKRLRLEQTGDSPQKQRELQKDGAQTVKDNANRAGMGGFVSGGF